MSRLLTALKRLEEDGANRSAEPRPSDRHARGSGSVAAEPPEASPHESAADPIPADPTIDSWPSGKPTANEVIPLAPLDETASKDAASRGVRSASPGRRATDRYRVAPEYATLCQTILEQVPRTRPTSILIVPAEACVDAGTVAAEMALSMAQAVDLPVVAIDADFAVETGDAESAVFTSGLADVLLDRIDWRGVLSPARDGRVQLLASGRPLGSGESIASAATRLGPIAGEIKTRYRYLIVHGGLSSNPLAGALVQASDLVYLVVRLGETSRRAARTAKRMLQRGGAIVHGSILLSGPSVAANA